LTDTQMRPLTVDCLVKVLLLGPNNPLLLLVTKTFVIGLELPAVLDVISVVISIDAGLLGALCYRRSADSGLGLRCLGLNQEATNIADRPCEVSALYKSVVVLGRNRDSASRVVVAAGTTALGSAASGLLNDGLKCKPQKSMTQ
jgi:hypothetical protein